MVMQKAQCHLQLNIMSTSCSSDCPVLFNNLRWGQRALLVINWLRVGLATYPG